MSHVATIDIEVRDLDALAEAAKRIGLELVRGQTTYRWWGTHVGDYPLPAGFTAADLGKCEHAIVIPGDERAYQIGVCARRDGRPGYTLLWDFIAGGYGLEAKVGRDCCRLRQEYAAVLVRRELRLQGCQVLERRLPNGQVVVTGRRA